MKASVFDGLAYDANPITRRMAAPGGGALRCAAETRQRVGSTTRSMADSPSLDRKFESISLHRRVCEPSVPLAADEGRSVASPTRDGSAERRPGPSAARLPRYWYIGNHIMEIENFMEHLDQANERI
jgi:hypothetical protein